jgi:hypothetical protein
VVTPARLASGNTALQQIAILPLPADKIAAKGRPHPPRHREARIRIAQK